MNAVDSKKTRCRFAPSPTGMLHVGGARTALFNYLFARSTGGSYVLRIEDSDRERSTEEAYDAILKGLEWLGLLPDEEIYYQSKQFDLYTEKVKQLLESGDAYPCDVTAEELDEMREQQKSEGKKPRYDGRCRPKDKSSQSTQLPQTGDETPFVIRLRMPESGVISYSDALLGEIETPAEELDDFVIVRGDGTPTYNLVNAIDDIEMEITHVLRGNEHVANTPKQIMVYHALGAPLPVFAHFPLILGTDKKKLSKRHGATSVFEYRTDGYLPDAFVNYLARLGWSAGDQEIFSRKELEQAFSLDGVGKSPSVFDVEKLRWVNAEHMKLLSEEDLKELVLPYIVEICATSESEVTQILNSELGGTLLKEARERSRTLSELASGLSWLFQTSEQIAPDDKDRNKAFRQESKEAWVSLREALEQLLDFKAEQIEQEFKAVLETKQIKFGKLGLPLRLALTGEKGGLPLFLMMEALGKAESMRRLQKAESYFS